jgi:hypothetical protein
VKIFSLANKKYTKKRKKAKSEKLKNSNGRRISN